MSWSLPRLSCKPQRDSSSSEASVRRPLFCTAIFRRGAAPLAAPAGGLAAGLGAGFGVESGILLQAVGDGPIAAVAGGEIASDPADGGDADAGLPVDLAVGQAAFQELDHRPAVGHGLQLGGRAQVAKEAAALLDAAQRQNGGA